MKTFLVPAVALMAIVYQPAAQAQVPIAAKIEKIEPAAIKTPEYNVTGGPQKRSTIGTWLEVEVEFETKGGEAEELTFNYYVAIENKLVVGSVTHVAVPEGKKHFSVVYIAPRSLEKLTGGKPLTSGNVQNVWVTISRQGQVLDKGSAPKKMELPNLPQIQGMILNKSETPFAPLFFDRYEAVKPTR